MANEDIQFSAGLDTSQLKRDLLGVTGLVKKAAQQANREANLEFSIKKIDTKSLASSVAEAVKTAKELIQDNLGSITLSEMGSRGYANLGQLKQPQSILKGIQGADTGKLLAEETRLAKARESFLADFQANIKARYAEQDKIVEESYNGQVSAAKARAAEEERLRRGELASLQANIKARYAAQDKLDKALGKLAEQRRKEEAKAADAQIKAQQALQNSLPRLRYALYDIQNITTQIGQTLTGVGTDAVKTFMQFETAFTGVERTSNVSGDAASRLKNELIGLTREVPLSFQEVASIATLGAQLGIAETELKSFTKTVSEFASITGISVESSATAFGSLGNLLDLTVSQYDNLGSSIAYAGINAVATESEIVSVATAIGGVANQAGLSAEYVVGLSTALASLKVPSEQSRGALTRVFQEVNRAATINPAQMDEFANVLGVTTQKATELAKTDMGSFFTLLVNGLNRVTAADPTKITAQLDALNLSDIRITNTLTRLSQNPNLLADSLNNASGAFSEGTFLADSYAKKLDDLASKFQILQNAFAEFSAQLGGGLAGFLSPIISAVSQVMNFLNDLLKTPIGGFFGFVLTSIMGLVGGVFILAGALAGLRGGMLAFRTALNEIQRVGGQASGSLAAMTAMLTGLGSASERAAYGLNIFSKAQVSATTTANTYGIQQGSAANKLITWGTIANNAGSKVSDLTQKIGGLSAAFKGLAKVTLISAAISAAMELFSIAQKEIENRLKTSTQRAVDYYGQSAIDSIAQAAQQDTRDYLSGAQGSDTIFKISKSADTQSKSLSNDSTAAQEAVNSIKGLAEAQTSTAAAIANSTSAIDNQTIAFGRNAEQAALKAVQDKILGDADNPLTKIFKDKSAVEALKQAGVDVQRYTKAIITGNDKVAKEEINKLTELGIKKEQIARAQANAANASVSDGTIATQVNNGVIAATEGLREFGVVTRGIVPDTAALNANLAATGGELETVSQEVVNAMGTLQQFKGDFNDAFGKSDEITKMTDSLMTLIDGIDAGGTSFNRFTNNGAQNLQNFRQAMYDTASGAEALGYDAAVGVGMVFSTLQQKGIDTANLLKNLKSMGGDYATYANQISIAQSGTYAGLTSAFNDMGKAAKKAKDAAADAAKQFRTAMDVANDFSSVAKRALDLRFGKQDALDKITSGWFDMADAIQQADDSLNQLNADIQSLTADKKLKEYFLEVAIAVGDTVKAEQLRAEIGKINNDIAQKDRERAKAADEANKTLRGNSAAAIKNRSTMRGMVNDYQSYIQTLISSGASQKTVSAAIKQSKQDFIDQATALGYNADELKTFTSAFDDMLTINKNTDYTVSVNIAGLDPAKAALLEFKAKADDAAKNRTSTLKMDVDYAAMAKWSRGIELLAKIDTINAMLTQVPAGAAWNGRRWALQNQIKEIKDKLNSGNFASGGYTGTGGKFQVAGIVHRGEYVIPREQVNQATGLPYFMSQPRSFAAGGFTGQTGPAMVMLSPEDRALLRQVGGSGEVVLYANNEAIARSSNAGNQSIIAFGGRP